MLGDRCTTGERPVDDRNDHSHITHLFFLSDMLCSPDLNERVSEAVTCSFRDFIHFTRELPAAPRPLGDHKLTVATDTYTTRSTHHYTSFGQTNTAATRRKRTSAPRNQIDNQPPLSHEQPQPEAQDQHGPPTAKQIPGIPHKSP